jgi:hypothetical protein
LNCIGVTFSGIQNRKAGTAATPAATRGFSGLSLLRLNQLNLDEFLLCVSQPLLQRS